MILVKDRDLFCSWSGGKDSCLALYRAIKEGGRPKALLTMFREGGERSRSHGLTTKLIEKQASSLNIPLITRPATWENYEQTFINALHGFKDDGINVGVFGDIDLDPHLEWVEKVCAKAGIEAYEPLWKCKRGDLLDELFAAGFKATIVSIKESLLDKKFLGMTLSPELIKEFAEIGIDPSGEEGEYHTVVTAGPIFSTPIELDPKEQVSVQGYRFLDVSVID